MQRIEVTPLKLELDWLDRMKEKLDEGDRLLSQWPFENPAFQGTDIRNGIRQPDEGEEIAPPEPEDDSTGFAR